MADPASWDLLDEDCSDISDWTDGDGGDGVSEVSPAGQFHLYCPSASSGELASRYRDIGSYPTQYTIEFKIYFDAPGVTTSNDYFTLVCQRANHQWALRAGSDGMFLRDIDGYVEVGTNLVQSEVWQVWRFVVDLSAGDDAGVTSVYLNGVYKGILDTDREVAQTNGMTVLQQYGYTINTEIHIDYLKIATGLYTPEIELINNAVFFGMNF